MRCVAIRDGGRERAEADDQQREAAAEDGPVEGDATRRVDRSHGADRRQG
jgi:hypothetical protein